MKLIPLTRGYFAKVDDEDYERVNTYKWQIEIKTKTRIIARGKVRNRREFLHRFILNLYKNDEIYVDHINHDTLDNQKSNLRLVTPQQNMMNRKKFVKSTSKYKGVYLHKRHKKWQSGIYFNNKKIHLGHFNTEQEAAIAYNAKAKELFGEYACLNEL